MVQTAMTTDLRPLLLPQLVEERRKLEAQQQAISEADLAQIYYSTNSSSSDVGSPITPTFSTRGHLRCSSSVSSFDLSSFAESPSSPSQPAHSIKSCMRPLPDVEEEPVEHGELDLPEDLYDCLCDEPFCVHRSNSNGPDEALTHDFDVDYDLGFVSETDLSGSQQRKSLRAGAAESTLSGITSRIGSRFPGLSRWKGTRKGSVTGLSLYEISLESSPALAYAHSSRSSSISSPQYRPDYDSAPHTTVSPSPRQSFWESTDSVVLPPLDVEKRNSGRSLERERALAATPLLPPLVIDASHHRATVPLPPMNPERETQIHVPTYSRAPSPTISAKPSIASFRPSPTSPDMPIPFPNLLNDDEWSDRLGHANFTILPLPYEPEESTIETLKKLREDWDLARINYTKHLFRTGENYGETSKIYSLTEEKWAGVDRSWRRFHDETMERILASGAAQKNQARDSAGMSRGRGRGRVGSSAVAMGRSASDDLFAGIEWKQVEEARPTALPRMLSEDKFPSRGDEDIVGPMVRDAVMVRTCSEDARGVRMWRNLVDKVGGLRR